jgi:hypothetical protein
MTPLQKRTSPSPLEIAIITNAIYVEHFAWEAIVSWLLNVFRPPPPSRLFYRPIHYHDHKQQALDSDVRHTITLP